MRDKLRKRRTNSEDHLDSAESSDMEDRIPTERVQKYESVAVDELAASGDNNTNEPSDEDDDDVDNGELGRLNGKNRRRRLRAPPSSYNQGGSVVLGNAKLVVLVLAVVLGAVLIMWQSAKATKKKNRGSTQPKTSGKKWFLDDDDSYYDDDIPSRDKSVRKSDYSYPVHYDLKWMGSEWNPFDMNDKTAWDPPSLPWTPDTTGKDAGAYLMQPDVNNRLVVFISEGDLYVTEYSSSTKATTATSAPAAKITTTVGNVRTPRLHPDQPVVAFTATYQGRREVYLQDLRRGGATRLTFWDDPYGVPIVVGWKDAQTLVIAARHTAVAMPDIRLFLMTLAKDHDEQQQPHAVMDVTPVPLAQAQDAAIQTFDKDVDCYYFTRNSQSSHTLRYVGGTVEQLWAYCDGYDRAIPLTTDYKGTSKLPALWSKKSGTQQAEYLIFASDRAVDKNGSGRTSWIAGTMNLWAMKLPPPKELYANKKGAFDPPPLIQITELECWQQGRTLQEFRVDPVKRNIVLRMGADLFEVSSNALDAIFKDGGNSDAKAAQPVPIAIQVVSDFHETQERLIPFNMASHWINGDVVTLPSGQISVLLTLRGQTWVAPILHDTSLSKPYQGGGQNMPPRRYRVAPGALTGGAMRILNSVHVPLHGDDPIVWGRRLAVILATDPLSPTAEHAFYLLPIQENAPSAFADLEHAPLPFLGGHVNGGSTKDGGLGSVLGDTVTVSPCGRRLAWADTDGNIAVMTLPLFHQQYNTTVDFTVLSDTNELGEPMDGTLVDLLWSPGGRYLAITHAAKNKFNIISVADCGDPLEGSIKLGRVVQATPSRFNSMSPYWGESRVDSEFDKYATMMSKATGDSDDDDEIMATTLYFLTDRDIMNDASSPWGHRAPMPHFPRRSLLYALPLLAVGSGGVLDPNVPLGRFSGGAPMEVLAKDIQALTLKIKDILKNKISGKRQLEDTSRRLAQSMAQRGFTAESPQLERVLKNETVSVAPSTAPTTEDVASPPNPFPVDMEIEFGPKDLSFARRAYRMANVPESNYYQILSQTEDDGSLLLIDAAGMVASIKVFAAAKYPYDEFKAVPLATPGKRLLAWGQSTDRQFIYLTFAPGTTIKVLKNVLTDVAAAVKELSDGTASTHLADLDKLSLSVWPKLEYRQLYNDAWRMLRDYFWDVEMHQVDWPEIHARYSDLVDRCNKREELDDVLAQMAAELSALHVFVYGGEYNAPFRGDDSVISLHEPASLGASLERAPEWKGYKIKEIPYRDPDFNLVVGKPVYSPLSSQALWQTGQKGLQVGDVIVGVNGESVFRMPDIGMLLRGMAGRSVRLEVLRLASGDHNNATDVAVPEPVLVVPLTTSDAASLRYTAWEYQTRELAKSLADEAGFTVGYAHLRAMSGRDINAFATGFFEDYNKQTLILDVRHNHGGNIDSWVTTMLQRAAWSYFGGRTRFGGGDLDWDQQGSFQGHVVVLIDEHTSSDGEGVSRSISELGLGKLIGTRTWGGGIWLASDNKLVDGGIATAPEFGVYNEKFGWGMGIEQQGVEPDIEVDNDPRMAFDGKDAQLERAIAELQKWLKEEPVVIPKPPVTKPDKSLPPVSCPANR